MREALLMYDEFKAVGNETDLSRSVKEILEDIQLSKRCDRENFYSKKVLLNLMLENSQNMNRVMKHHKDALAKTKKLKKYVNAEMRFKNKQ